ncbi:TlpA disulfide reductase family protein [Flavobacterium sp.]|uniref:TlpA family protein disulfide reductase n=1 Tax=Flavobacterium sp. TaxID=239 RepID=UPI0026174EA2|nr:TlpA disulfide reductase family protein [Flavobacterium sp.]
MKNKLQTITVLFILMAMVIPFAVYAQTKNAPKSLPDIEVKLQDGDSLNLKDLKGKVVLLDFWYRGCYPCLKAVPHLIELQEEFKDDLVIIGMNDFDIQEDTADYFTYKKANYRSTFKTKVLLYKLFNVEGFPTTLLYDKEGNLIKADTGFSEGMMRSLRRAVKKTVQ